MAKTTFIKYMSPAHLNFLNIEAREYANGSVCLAVEHVVKNARLSPIKRFASIDDAQEWYDSLPGNSMGRLDNALDILLHRD